MQPQIQIPVLYYDFHGMSEERVRRLLRVEATLAEVPAFREKQITLLPTPRIVMETYHLPVANQPIVHKPLNTPGRRRRNAKQAAKN